MIKKCEKCGKEKPMMFFETFCDECEEQIRLELAQKLAEEEKSFDTFSDSFVICPYCGNALCTDVSYSDFPEIYEEGDHKLTCPECDKDFILNTYVSYSYETEKIDSEVQKDD